MAIDAAAMTIRAAELLTDEEFDFWSADFHARSVSEAVCLIAEVRTDAQETECQDITYTTVAGAQQQLPETEPEQRFGSVVANASGRSIRQKDRRQLDNLIPCWADKPEDWKGYVEFWTSGGCDDQSFMLYPPPPAGHEITVQVRTDAAVVSAEDLGCEHESLVLDYMLWRAFEREGSENVNKWQGYRQSFWDQLGVLKAVDQERALKKAGCYDRLCDKGSA